MAQERKKFFGVPRPVFLAERFMFAKILREPLVGLPRSRKVNVGAPQGDEVSLAVTESSGLISQDFSQPLRAATC